MKLSVIVPVYNEQPTIMEVLSRILACGLPDLEVLIVDDCSTDGTRDLLKHLPVRDHVRVLYHEHNQGKGAAIRTAQQHCTGAAVVVQDADLEYDPREFPRLLRPLADDVADVVYGSRYSGTELLVDAYWHYLGNRCLTTFSNLLSNLNLSDMETCYKMVRGDLFRSLKLECPRFGIEVELTAKLARRRCRIYEIPISYRPRRFAEGKKIGWPDAVAAVWYIVKYNLLVR